MKRRIVVFVMALVLILGLFPLSGLAENNLAVAFTYNANDYNKMQAFLDLPSSVGGETNGQRINPSYNRDDPSTWTEVIWNSDPEKRIEIIGGFTNRLYLISYGL